MQEPVEGIMEELHNLLTKLNNEADKLHKNVDAVQKLGEHIVSQAESVMSTNIRKKVKDKAKDTLIQFVEQMVEMNCNFELADICSSDLSIPYLPVGESTVKLKFLAGDSPWNFWLLDETVDSKTVSKILLKKYQNGLLEPCPNPKSSESVCFLDRNKVFRGIVLQVINENRVKVLDCDSNISKAILSDKLFKVDPDACSVHASAINCTITKESAHTDLWTTDLRDVFCNALKEAVLNVKIIERLTGSLPCFIVSVEMKNDEENCDGSLEEWILNRLLPELKKLSNVEDESVCDFLSSESLNPYHKFTAEASHAEKVKTSSNDSLNEGDNNLNSSTIKVTTKIVNNIINQDDGGESIVSSSSEEGLGTHSSCEPQLSPELSHNDQDIDKKLNNTELKSIRSSQTVAARLNRINQQPRSVVSQPLQMNGPYHFGYPVQFPVPYSPMQRPPPPPVSQWGFQLRPAVVTSQLYPQPIVSLPEAINGPMVNVMAPEFVPKANNDMSQNMYTPRAVYKKHSATPEHADHKEIAHVLLRKPSSLLKPGEKLVVMISHIVSPAEFYVHFVTKNNKYLDKLMDDMFSYYNNNQKKEYMSWQEAKKAVGEFCACKWMQDNHWYRVQVENWCPFENHVKVVFVDHGNVDIVPLDCIQPLAQQFTKLSMCAQLCHLAKVLPSVKNKPWSDEAIQFFKSKVEANNSSAYSVTVVPHGDYVGKINSLSVLLFEEKASEAGKSINEQMVDLDLAWSKHFLKQISFSDNDSCVSLENDHVLEVCDVLEVSKTSDKLASPKHSFLQSVPDQLPPEEENEWNNWDPLAEEYNSVRNNPARDTDDPGVALIGYSAKDEQRICQFYARDGFCRKQICNKEHSMPNPDGVTTDKEEGYKLCFTEMALPEPGENIGVLVTSVSSICLFYVQLPQKQGLDIKFDDEEEETLSLLTDFMNKPENIHQMKFLKVSANVGQLVLAKWDGQWYRARVISCDADEDSLEVIFVDFGSLGFVSELDLREMEPRYLHLPFQAVECSLANINPPDSGSPEYEKATNFLRKLIEGNRFEAKVYDSCSGEEFNEMKILLRDSEGDVSERLLGSGLVTERKFWNSKSRPYLPG